MDGSARPAHPDTARRRRPRLRDPDEEALAEPNRAIRRLLIDGVATG